MRIYKAQIQGVFKSVSEDSGKHFIELLCSGTKLDKGGDKVAPEMLASMKSQADAGRVMLLENHGATLPMGISTGAEIVPGDDGSQSLFITFELDDSHPLVLTLLKQIAEGYQPQCSIGVDVLTETVFDEAEGKFVRVLTEGQFEHVALTRPDRAQYGEAMITLAKSLDEAIVEILKINENHVDGRAKDHESRAASHDVFANPKVGTAPRVTWSDTPTHPGQQSFGEFLDDPRNRGPSSMQGRRRTHKESLENKSTEQKAAPAEENTTMSYKEVMAKRAEACKALREKMDAAKCNKSDAPAVEKTEAVAKDDSTAVVKDEIAAGFPPPKKEEAPVADAPIAKDDMAMSLDTIKDVHGNIGALHKLMKEGMEDKEATPEDGKALLSHVMSELELMEQAMAALAAAGDLAPEEEEAGELKAEPPPPAPSENPNQGEAPAKGSEEGKKPEEKTEGVPVVKSTDAAKAEHDKTVRELQSVIKSLTGRIDALEKMPSGTPPQRYNGTSEPGPEFSQIVKSLAPEDRLAVEKTAAASALADLFRGKRA